MQLSKSCDSTLNERHHYKQHYIGSSVGRWWQRQTQGSKFTLLLAAHTWKFLFIRTIAKQRTLHWVERVELQCNNILFAMRQHQTRWIALRGTYSHHRVEDYCGFEWLRFFFFFLYFYYFFCVAVVVVILINPDAADWRVVRLFVWVEWATRLPLEYIYLSLSAPVHCKYLRV